MEGIRLEKVIEGKGLLTLQFEHNLEEVLKIGTYVDSCVALGGFNSFNASSVALDANKQVVFARDAKGKFVARQVVALSEKHQLLCYDVYFRGGSCDELEKFFIEYDKRLASRLGVIICDDCDIEPKRILSSEWYQDCFVV